MLPFHTQRELQHQKNSQSLCSTNVPAAPLTDAPAMPLLYDFHDIFLPRTGITTLSTHSAKHTHHVGLMYASNFRSSPSSTFGASSPYPPEEAAAAAAATYKKTPILNSAETGSMIPSPS
jgi:hypothetical protein